MKFKNYLQEKEKGEFIYISSVLELLEVLNLHNDSLIESEPSLNLLLLEQSKLFKVLNKVAKKLGLRLKKSETIFSYIKKSGPWFEELLRLASLYLLTDVRDRKTRKQIMSYARKMAKDVNPKEIAAFLMQLDRAAFGLTAHLRHILMSIFGIEVATYNKWLDDPEYIEKEFKHVKIVAKRRGLPASEIAAIDKLQQRLIQNIRKREQREKKNLSEWNVRFEYSGRDLVEPARTILWYYFTTPKFIGLIWVKPDGTILIGNKKIGRMIPPDDYKATHKRLLSEIYKKIGMDKMEGMTGNKRDDIENTYENNIRGRIIGDDIYVWQTGISIRNRKIADRAIDAIYKYIDESLVESKIINISKDIEKKVKKILSKKYKVKEKFLKFLGIQKIPWEEHDLILFNILDKKHEKYGSTVAARIDKL